MARWGYDDHYYEPSRPLKAKGGIKARTRRGAFGESWWARRWIQVLEGFNIGERLARGRSYARKGQVLSIDVDEGVVRARVQGSRPRPYDVVIKVKTLSQAEWKRVARSLASQAALAASLLAGRMPENIESAFEAAGVSLFPSRSRDLHTDCSCPDWSNPCKHVAAVYYLLAEEFDRDPFLVFKMRGMTREKLVELIGGAGGRAPAAAATAFGSPEPLPVDPSAFWGWCGTVSAAETGSPEVAAPVVDAALVRRLGGFPFWRGEEGFLPAMEEVYRAASPLGLNVFVGERLGKTSQGELPQDEPSRAEPAPAGRNAGASREATGVATVKEGTLGEGVAGATPEQWRALYLACEEFRNLAPWDWMDDTQVVGVRDPVSGEVGWCVVMGSAREVFGLWVYRGARGYAAYSLMACGVEPDFDDAVMMDYLSLSFGSRSELERADLELIRESGLKPRGRHAWPLVRAKAPWRVPWRLNAGEVRFMTLALGQVSEKAMELKENPGTRLVRGTRLLVREPVRTGGELRWKNAWVEPGVPEPEEVSLILDQGELDDIRRGARLTGETWEADVFPLEALVREEVREAGAPYYPMTLLVVNRGVPPIVHFAMEKPEPSSWQILTESLVSALKNMGRLPKRIRVARPAVAAVLSPICSALGIQVKEVERLPALQQVKRDLEEYARL